MKKSERIVNVRFSGHGHYKVTIVRYGVEHTATIDDMPTIDNYKDGTEVAANNLYDMVIRKCNLAKYSY